MRLPRVALVLWVGCISAIATACRLQTEATPAEARQLAPDFVLPSYDGTTVTLGQLLERGPAILVFYRGHW